MKVTFLFYLTILFFILLFILFLYYAYLNIYILFSTFSILNNSKTIYVKDGCVSKYGKIANETNTSKIERNTLKALICSTQTKKLMSTPQSLIPSIYNGTYCEINYTEYYDFKDRNIFTNRIFYKKDDVPNAIRVREYYFSPGKYFELKWKGYKLRGLIDDKYNLIQNEKLTKNESRQLNKYLHFIKIGKLKQKFTNTYTRFSYIYADDEDVRITIDTNMSYQFFNATEDFKYNILEIKIPKNYSKERTQKMIANIEDKCNVELQILPFSKFEYGYNTFLPN